MQAFAVLIEHVREKAQGTTGIGDDQADIEVVKIQDVNKSFERVVAKDVRYRFVIDMTSLKG